MGSTIITGLCDSHWSDRRPASRTDPDWVATQSAKIDFLFDFSTYVEMGGIKGASAIVHAGDVFNQPEGKKIHRSVDQWLMGKIRKSPCPIFAIPGNHDMWGHTLSSLKDHPYGCLESAGLLTSVVWPNYALVGVDPVVLVTGKEFIPDGPVEWLEWLRDTQTLVQWKKDISQEYQKPVYVLVMTHGHWGADNGYAFGEPVTSYCEVVDTGIDVMLVGHPHCVVPSTWIESPDIGMIRIGDVIEEGKLEKDLNLRVSTDFGVENATKAFNFYNQPTIKIKTQFGFELEGVGHHRVRIAEECDGGVWVYGWARLDEITYDCKVVLKLGADWPEENVPIPYERKRVEFYGGKVGEEEGLKLIHSLKNVGWKVASIVKILNQKKVLTRKGKKWRHSTVAGILSRSADAYMLVRVWKAPERLNADLSDLLGWYTAEGSLFKGGVSWCCGTEWERDRVMELGKKVGLPMWWREDERYVGLFDVRTNCVEFRDWILFIECGRKAELKKVPWPVLRGTRETVMRYLDGYIGGDGSASKLSRTVES
jgi:hypothetical protein